MALPWVLTAGQGLILKLPMCGGRERPALQNERNGVANRGPRAAAGFRGRIWNPPLQMAARPEATGKRRSPLPWQTLTGPLVKGGGESGDRGSTSPRNDAFFKRQPGVRQSLRHGLRPCHLPLTREAKPPHPAANRKPVLPQGPVGRDACIPAGRTGVFWRFCENPGRWFEFSASYGIIAGKRLLYDFCTAARRSGWRRPGNRLLARDSTIPLRGMV